MSDQHYLFRVEAEPYQRYTASAREFQICVICSLCVLPGQIIFDIDDQTVAHDSCDESRDGGEG